MSPEIPSDETFEEHNLRIREACNAENNDELPDGCMYPWCLCNRLPEKSDG